ncbi:ParD-like antitoxin of type II toxin-antitoxin system [Pseudomonas palleroniana]|uniref:ParD-like antitoxin of type II toxin-antitoxin system n=2 Tax=Pseudomonas palleroniana TaxID=191390 RepID=A0A1H5P5B9_9PSED|nr:ParD-like antitoxin of type II toxin-antitoxin system [Pseudomonas palleroniana]
MSCNEINRRPAGKSMLTLDLSAGLYERYMKHIRFVYSIYAVNPMGIIKITDPLHEQLRLASAAMDRSINAQAEFWIKIGLLAELNPHLPYNELINKLLLDKPDLIRGRS